MDTADRYRWFAEFEARGVSPCYEEWCQGISGDEVLLGLIEDLPLSKRQPNLVLAAARLQGAKIAPFDEFRRWLIEAWPMVRQVALARSTQTNEAGRAAVLLPILAALPGPLSLIEVAEAAAGIASAEPPLLVRGDLNAKVPELVAAAPKGTTVVVFHSAVLSYLSTGARLEFQDAVRQLPCRWIANEGIGVIASAVPHLPQPVEEHRGKFVLTLDGEPQAWTTPHGQSLDWFARSG